MYGGSNVTGPRSNLIIIQYMFEVESCLRNGMQLLPCRKCLLLAQGGSKTKSQWQGRFTISPAKVCSIVDSFGITSNVNCNGSVLGYDRPAKVCSMNHFGVMSKSLKKCHQT